MDQIFEASRADWRSIGPLLESLEHRLDIPMQELVERELVKLLLDFTESEREVLDEQQWSRIRRLLRSRNADLVVAALHALEVAGDWKALRDVDRTKSKARRGADAHRIRDAAKSCTARIVERFLQDHEQWTLVRPTHAPSVASNASTLPPNVKTDG